MLYMTDFLEKQLASFEDLPFGVLDATALSQVAMVHAKDTMPPLPGKKPHAGLRTIFDRHAEKPPIHFIDMLRAEYFPTMFANLLSPTKAKEAFFGVAAQPALSRHARARLPGRLQHRTPGPVRRHDLYVQGPVHLRFVSRNGHLTRWLARGLQHGVHHARSRTRPGPAIPRGRRRAEAPAQASLRRWPLQGR